MGILVMYTWSLRVYKVQWLASKENFGRVQCKDESLKKKVSGVRPGVECKVVSKVYKVDMKNWDVVQQMSYPIHARALLNHAIGFIGSLAIYIWYTIVYNVHISKSKGNLCLTRRLKMTEKNLTLTLGSVWVHTACYSDHGPI